MFVAYVSPLSDGCYLVEFGTTGRNGKVTAKHIYHTERQAVTAQLYYQEHGDVRQARENALAGNYESLIKIW